MAETNTTTGTPETYKREIELTERHNEKADINAFSLSNDGGHDVLVSYNYMLRVEGMYDLPCKAVHSFTKENEFEYVQEGGLNDYVHLLRKPVTKPFTFTVERYVGTDSIPYLPLGAELVLPVILMVSPFPNDFGKSKRTFVFTGCTVMSKTFGELNAEKSGLLTESIVIGYREMTEVNVPVHAGKDGPVWAFEGRKKEGNKNQQAIREAENADNKPVQSLWAFDKNKVEGNAKQRARKYDATDISAVDEIEDRKWGFDKVGGPKKFEGIGTRSAMKYEAEDISATDKVADRIWAFDKTNRKNAEGTGTRSALKHTEVDLPKVVDAEANENGAGNESNTFTATRWSFDRVNKKNYKGKGKQSAQKYDVGDTANDQIEDRKWAFDHKKVAGKGKQSAQKYETKDISATDKVADRKWAFDKNDKNNATGTGVRSAMQLTEADLPKKTEADEAENGATGEITGGDADNRWRFSKNAVMGNGKTRAVREEATKAELRRWETPDDAELGGGTSSANKNKNDSDKPVARKWAFDKDNYLGAGDRSALQHTEADLPKKTEADEAENGATGEITGGDADNRWRFSKNAVMGNGKTRAVREEATKAELRRWETPEDAELGGGKSSANKNQNDADKPVARKWAFDKDNYLGAGDRSALQHTEADLPKKTEADEAANGETNEVVAAGSRKWAFNKKEVFGNGNRSARTEADTDAVTRQWGMDGSGKASAKTEADTTAVGRQWSMDGSGKASAKTEEDTAAVGRQWSMDGSGKASAKTEENTAAVGRQWSMDGSGKASAKTAENTAAVGRQWSIDGKGTASAKTEEDTAAVGRQWSIDGKGTASAKTEEDTAAVGRQWSMDGSGKASAKTEEDTAAVGRRWSMDGKGTASAKTEEDTAAVGRQWNISGKGKPSAKTEKSAEVEKRRWSMDGKNGKKTSANMEKNTEAKARRWETAGDNKLGGGTSSAVTEKASKSEKRKWPEVSSAKMREENKRETTGRKWPAVSSAKKRV